MTAIVSVFLMQMVQQFKIWIANDRNQRLVSRLYRGIVALILVWFLGRSAWVLLPDQVLFFFTCDAFELSLSALLAWGIFDYILRVRSLGRKVLLLLIPILLLGLVAYLKYVRRGIDGSNLIDDWFSYLGMMIVFLAGFYFFDHLNFFINSSHMREQQLLRDARKALLRLQLSPHFLYNAFNSLYGMSLRSDERTPQMVLALSGMMRYITDESKKDKSLLIDELRFIENYLSVERIRFGEDAKIEYLLDGDPSGYLIEPLILISPVENAFKHGFYTNDPQAYVNIKFSILTDGTAVLTVANRIIERSHEPNRKGSGLEQLRERLRLSYPDTGKITIVEGNDIYRLTMQMKLAEI